MAGRAEEPPAEAPKVGVVVVGYGREGTVFQCQRQTAAGRQLH